MEKFIRLLCCLLCLSMVFSSLPAVIAAEGDVFTKLTDVAELAVGDQIILVADDGECALSTWQKTNNRGASSVTKDGDLVTAAADTQVLTVAAGTVEGTVAFWTGKGYLCAASSTSNQLKTAETLDADSSWRITITDGVTSVVAQGEKGRNVLQYNPNDGDPVFSCYDSDKMGSVSIYKLTKAAEDSQVGENTEPVEVTIAQALQLAREENGRKYLVRGTVTSVENATYGDLYIADEAGNRLYIHGVYDLDGTNRYDAMEHKIAVGDEVVLLGQFTTYNGKPQMVNGWLQSLTVGVLQPTPEPERVSIPEAIAIGSAKSHNSFTSEQYIVTGVIAEIKSTTYGNLYLRDSAGNTLYIYGLFSADDSVRFDGMRPQPAVGDTITVVGVLGQYNDTPQMKDGRITTVISAKPQEDPEKDPDKPADAPNCGACAALLSGAAGATAYIKFGK